MYRPKQKTLSPLRIAALYVLAGALWILFSDLLLAGYSSDRGLLTRLQTYKGWFFVLATGVLLYLLVRRYHAEQQQTRAGLAKSEEYHRMLFTHSPIGLALCKMDGTMIDVNPAFARVTGRSVEETLKMTYWDVTPEKYAELEQAQLRELQKTGHYGPYEKEYVHRDGHLVPVRLQGLLVERDGEQFIWSSVEDISNRKRTEEGLQRSEQVLRLFVEHSPAAIAMFDNDMKYIVASRRFLADYNLGDQNIIGRSHYEVFPEMTDRLRDIHRRCLAGAVEKSEEDSFQRVDGTTDWVRWEMRPWYEAQDEIGGAIFFSEVITERKRAEQELEEHREHLEELVHERTAELQDSRKALMNIVEDLKEKTGELAQANEKLKEIDRLKSLFIASMSHELRTPLNSIIGFTGILLQGMAGPMNEEQQKQLGMVKSSSQHLLALITDIIDLSKVEAGKIDIVVEKFDLPDVLREVAHSLHPAAVRKGLSLTLDAPGRLLVTSDLQRVRQILVNLVGNAVKFTERGSVHISLGNKNGIAEVSVRDTGIGIKAEDMPKLFKSFSQITTTDIAKHEGTGLGLYLSKKLVNLLGGEIKAESEFGKGSVFSFAIPEGRKNQDSEFRIQKSE